VKVARNENVLFLHIFVTRQIRGSERGANEYLTTCMHPVALLAYSAITVLKLIELFIM